MPVPSPTDQPPALTGESLVTLYDEVVGDVYGYLLRRCRDRAEAEDLTSDVSWRRLPRRTSNPRPT